MLGDMKAGIKFRTVDGPASRQAEHGNDGFRVLESFREIEVIAVNASDVNGPPARICERSLRIFKLRMLIPVMIDEHARESDDFAPLDDRQQKRGQAQQLLAFLGHSQRVIEAERGETEATTYAIERREGSGSWKGFGR